MRRSLAAALLGSVLILPVLAAPAHAQSAGCQAIANAASSAADNEITYLRQAVRKPRPVGGLTCLAVLTSISSMSADALVMTAVDNILMQIVTQICAALDNYWDEVLAQLHCGISVSGVGIGLPGLGGGQICQFNFGGGGPALVNMNAGIDVNGGGYFVPGMADGIAPYGR